MVEQDPIAYLVALVDARLRTAVKIAAPPFRPLGAMQAYHLGWFGLDLEPLERPLPSGKRLRPVFCLLACQALGGSVEASAGVAAAIELIHNFSLVHDDIQDRSRTRRGRPTVWSTWSTAQAINVGDALYATSNLAAIDGDLPAGHRLEAVRTLSEACVLLVEGQYLDLALQDQPSASFEHYEAMVGRKTAALIAASLECGAICAGATSEVRTHYHDLGYALGLAFQFQDDALGVWGDPKVTGKSVAADLRSGKKGLPAVLAFARARGADAHKLERLYRLPRRGREAIVEIRGLFDRLGVRQEAERVVEEQYGRAFDLLDSAPADSETRKLVRGQIDALANRRA